MKILIAALLALGFSTIAAADGVNAPDRRQKIAPLQERGLLTEKGAALGLTFNDEAFDSMVAAGNAMAEELQRRGYRSLDEAASDPVTLKALRDAGNRTLREKLGPLDNTDRMDNLTNDCVFPDLLNKKYLAPMS